MFQQNGQWARFHRSLEGNRAKNRLSAIRAHHPHTNGLSVLSESNYISTRRAGSIERDAGAIEAIIDGDMVCLIKERKGNLARL